MTSASLGVRLHPGDATWSNEIICKMIQFWQTLWFLLEIQISPTVLTLQISSLTPPVKYQSDFHGITCHICRAVPYISDLPFPCKKNICCWHFTWLPVCWGLKWIRTLKSVSYWFILISHTTPCSLPVLG